MAELVGSAVAGEVVSQVFSSVSCWYERGAGGEEKIKKMELNLLKIRSIIETAEKRQITNTSLRQWLTEIRRETDAGENTLNAFKTKTLNRELNKGGLLSSARRFLSPGERAAIRELNETLEQIERLTAQADDFVRLLEIEGCRPLLPSLISWPDSYSNMELKSGNVTVTQVPVSVPVFEFKFKGKRLFVVNFACKEERARNGFAIEMWVSWGEFGSACAAGVAECSAKLAEQLQMHMRNIKI